MRPHTSTPRTGHRSCAVICIALAAACAAPACSSAYRAALRDMALTDDDRLAARVDELVRCAGHAAESLERVAQWYTTHATSTESSETGSLRVSRGEAEAASFEAARRALSVRDVIAEMEPDAALRARPIMDASDAVADSLTRAVIAMNEGNLIEPERRAAFRAATAEAQHTIAALRDHARAIAKR